MRVDAGPTVVSGSVALFRADPDLLDGTGRVSQALRDILVPALTLPARGWSPLRSDTAFAYLVVRGSIAREIRIPGSNSVELLGEGDVVINSEPGDDAMLPSGHSWEPLEPSVVAPLDRDFLVTLARSPAVIANLLRRAGERADRNLVQMAIAGEHPVERRIELLLWHLADRWGFRRAGSIELPLRLTHRTLAALAATERERVSRVLVTLAAKGTIEKIPGKRIRLSGRPPSERLIEEAEEGLRLTQTRSSGSRPARSSRL